MAAAGGLAALTVVNAVDHRVSVLVTARAIRSGTAIAPGDLAVADVAVPHGVATVGVAHRDSLVGKVARTDLASGAVLAPDGIGDPAPPGQGQSLIVLALPASRIPVSGLRPGQPLVMVSTLDAGAVTAGSTAVDQDGAADQGGAAGQGTAASSATADAVVVRVADPGQDGTTSVDVAVHVGDGPLWAGLAAAGRVTVLVQAPRQVQR